MNTHNDEWSENLTLEEVEILFVTQSLDGHAPSVPQLIGLYPQWVDEIIAFALDFRHQQHARASDEEIPDVPESLRARIEERLQASREPASTLNEARKALKWTPEDLAQNLNLPTRVVVGLSRGLIQDWPRHLELKLSGVFMRPLEHIGALLRNSNVTPAANFSADGPIGRPNLRSQSFKAALEECERMHELTNDQRAEWLTDDVM